MHNLTRFRSALGPLVDIRIHTLRHSADAVQKVTTGLKLLDGTFVELLAAGTAFDEKGSGPQGAVSGHTSVLLALVGER